MDRLIEVKVNGHHLTKDNNVAGVQHESNATVLRIEFDPSWDGLAKKVTFWDALGQNPVERTLTADLLEDIAHNTRVYLCPIPGEAMVEAGNLEFVVDGWKDGRRSRSLSDTLKVKYAPEADMAGQPVDPSPTQAEQLQVQIDTMMGKVQEAVTAKEEAKAGAQAAAASAEAAAASAEAVLASERTTEGYVQEAATHTDNAWQHAQAAAQSEGNADIRATDAEAWAVGTRNGVSVDVGDATFMNNAKFYKEQAKEIAGGNFATEAYVDAAVQGFVGDIDCGTF